MTRAVLFAILLVTLAWGFWRLVDGVIETFGGTDGTRKRRRSAPPVKLVRDPVCGTWVSPANAQAAQAGSATHYFCSERCRAEFQKRS